MQKIRIILNKITVVVSSKQALQKMNKNPHIEAVTLRLNQFLEVKGYRRTQERYTILEEIYAKNDHHHFDANELRETLIQKGFHLSMATVYNTLELFVEAGLIKKHQFGGQAASHYERTVGSGQHDHILCLDCGFVKEFCDPRIHTIEKTVSDWFSTDIAYHSLVLYGHCTEELCKNRITKNVN